MIEIETIDNITISVGEYGGHKFVDIRKYFSDKDGKRRPTRKGIALSKEDFLSVLEVLNDKKEEILRNLG